MEQLHDVKYSIQLLENVSVLLLSLDSSFSCLSLILVRKPYILKVSFVPHYPATYICEKPFSSFTKNLSFLQLAKYISNIRSSSADVVDV